MKKIFSVLISNFVFATIFVNKALAQDVLGINDLADAGTALGSKTIQETIGGVVNIFLGFLGILATLLILYAGFLWMTSRGNAEKISRAKLLITSALIGLVIILSAYAITRYILSTLYDVAGPINPGGGGGPGPGGLPTCDAPANVTEALICSLSESIGQVGSGLTIRGYHFDTDTTDLNIGRVEIGGELAEIVECNGSQMWGEKKVKVKIPDALDPGIYPVALFNDLGNESIELPHFDFQVIPGTSLVNIDCLVPDEAAAGDLPINIQVLGDGFTDTWGNLSMTAWDTATNSEITLTETTGLNIIDWSDLEINMSVPANVISSDITVSVGLDSDSEFFTVSCLDSLDCNLSSNCCNLSNNSCVSVTVCENVVINPTDNAPIIQNISPEDGAGNTLVTIFGDNFGADADLVNPNVNERGVVTFNGVDGVLASTLSGGVCIDTWTDEYIVIGVPAGANELLDIDVRQALLYGGETNVDSYSGFTRDATIIRPGICSLDVGEGSFGDDVNISGISFAAGDSTYFDTVASYVTNVTGPNNATAQVPNVVGDLGVTMQSGLSGNSSNPFPFSALSTSGGNPIITELSPDIGPIDSYVTIMGSNFGNNVGFVYFDVDNISDNGNEELGLFDFPDQCGDYWFEDHIIVRVPDTINIGSHPIRVERSSDSALSNDFNFTVNTALLGPQICAITPDNGPVDNTVRIFGENLGPTNGNVIFYDNVSTIDYAIWNTNQVLDVTIPVGASTGPLVVQDNDGNDSNALLFSVGSCTENTQCGDTSINECCDGEFGNYCAPIGSCLGSLNSSLYAWEVSTQAEPFGLVYNYSCYNNLQSPTPWPNNHEWTDPLTGLLVVPNPTSEDVFVDSNIAALFTRDVVDDNFNNANIILHQCSDSTCSSYVGDVAGTIDILNQGTNREGFSFNPNVNLLPGTWYEVELGTFYAASGGDSWSPDPVFDEWTFRTRDGDLLCEVSSVSVTPQSPTADLYPGRNKNFSASPVADNCNICGGDYNWSWSLGPEPGPPELATDYVNPPWPNLNMSINKGSTNLVGGPLSTELDTSLSLDYVNLIAENTTYGISGESHPIILAPVLKVQDSVPSCSDSCLNASVWVDFNTTLTAPLDIDDFAIYRCIDEGCNAWDNSNNYTNILNTSILIDGTYRVELLHNLSPNENYQVIVDASITNIHGYPLGTDYRWDFGVSNNNCTINGASIQPTSHIAYSTDDISYKGQAIADGGSCGAQPIQCENCNFTWTSDDTNVATIEVGGIGVTNVLASPVDTGTTNINLTIDGTALVPDLGSAANNTPLDVVIGPVIPNDTALEIENNWPDCNGACSNSEVGVDFNMPVDGTTLGGSTITDITDPLNPIPVTNGYTLTGADMTFIIDHNDFTLGNTYRVYISPGIADASDPTNTLGTALTWDFTVGTEDCRIDSVNVIPEDITAIAGQGIPYSAQTMANTVSCGDIPIYCSGNTCTYAWGDNPDLGAFSFPDPLDHQDVIFTTFATVSDGDTGIVDVTVNDQGNNFYDFGNLTISIDTPLLAEVVLRDAFPDNIVNQCVNILPYFEFDVSNGNLDRDTLIDHAVFYEWVNPENIPIDFSIKFATLDPLNPHILTAFFQPSSVLDINRLYFYGVDDINAVLSVTGNPVDDQVPLTGNGTDSGEFFHTGASACPIHSVEITPQNDLFTCKDDANCEGDVGAALGNQHEYQSTIYDIQKNPLSSAGNTYTWSSIDDTIVDPLAVPLDDSLTFGTAGVNGITNLAVQVYMDSDPANIVADSNTVEVSTCQNPWPDQATYPWNPDDNPLSDMNFSTHYCIAYGLPDETPLPDINVPLSINSPNTDVIREYLTSIDYSALALNETPNNNFGSLAYYSQDEQKSWTKKLASLFKAEKTNSQELSGIDFLSVRVMSNPKHLSVLDWYNALAPNPVDAGTVIEVDGYEALQVGASIYIAAANIEANSLYTNIYIIAHNVGANEATLDIYNQWVENFKLNINLDTPSNTCSGQPALSCSSDFDCPSYCNDFSGADQASCAATWLSDTCDSSLLKLRRDTKRLGDLVNINEAVISYGANHKACSNNTTISCTTDANCASPGVCTSYYPALGAGTYLNGASNSRWPSWQDTFSSTLNTSIADDPINLFNGCTDPQDPDTCWDANSLEFVCPANSLVYMYNIEGVGHNYFLGANFEYDIQNPTQTNFVNNLTPAINDLDLNINSYCNFLPVDAPGASASPYCGNGIIDDNYCTVPCENCTTSGECTAVGGEWIDSEECDSEFWTFACSESPPNANPPFPIVNPADAEWWNEQTVGCNPPGAVDAFGNLTECTWYRPQPDLVAEQCGGYCGDGIRQKYYETCDGSVPNEGYVCVDGNPDDLSCNDGCQVICTDSAGTYPAALCGDGIWSEGTEQCDPSATPNGNAGWDCSEGGAIGCSNSCARTCTVGEPYAGLCGDGVTVTETSPLSGSAYEECDYANYDPSIPVDSSETSTYGCTLSCQFNNEFCGDGITQYEYQEICDYQNGAYQTPSPLFSEEFRQYACRDSGTYEALNTIEYGACTATLDGWCGDGYIQDGTTVHNDDNNGTCVSGVCPAYGEECDPGSLWDNIPQSMPPSWPTAGSSEDYQYLCDVDCVGTTGGYCGDGKADEPYEVCDGADFPTRPIPANSSVLLTYTCADDCSGAVLGGGYCGDGVEQAAYYEACDWGDPEDPSYYPWPRGTSLSNFSNQMDQYECNSCANYGGYCGNGIIDGACAANDGTRVNCTDFRCETGGTIDYSISTPQSCGDEGGLWIPTSSVGCSRIECEAQVGTTFYPYEQCDSGFDPAYVVNKDVDIVYLMDTSGGMGSHAANLCSSTATVAATLTQNHPDIDFRITIFAMGDGDGTDGRSNITPTETDDIQQFFKDTNDWNSSPSGYQNSSTYAPYWQSGYVPAADPAYSVPYSNLDTTDWLYDRVFNAFYSDCSDLVTVNGDANTPDTFVYPNVRYLSLYDDATNDIDGDVYVPYDDSHFLGDGVNEICSMYDLTENWGYAMNSVIENYNWLPDHNRIVVPVSNEGAVCGGSASENEDFDDTDGIYDILVTASELAENNNVFINPVLLGGGQISIGQRLAEASSGLFTDVSTNWEVQTLQVINATSCDGAGGTDGSLPYGGPDGHMDCKMEGDWTPLEAPEPPVPVITSPLSVTVGSGEPFTYTITATNNPTAFNAVGLPFALTVDQNSGVISGSTVLTGTYNVTITATNGTETDVRILNLTVTPPPPPPQITSPLVTSVDSGAPFSYTITATNSPSSFDAVGLPLGLSIDTTTGVISGSSIVVGPHDIAISASNGSGTDTENLNLSINAPPPPVITSSLTASVGSGNPFSYTITATNNPSSFDAVALPLGLSINTATGVISGSTTIAGVHYVTISASNGLTDTQTLTLTVTTATPVITSASSASMTRTYSFSHLVQATNNPTSFGASNLPAGLSINTTNGVVSGTPTVGSGIYDTIIFSASNAGGTATQNFTLNINYCASVNQSCSSDPCCSGLSCSSGSCSDSIISVQQ